MLSLPSGALCSACFAPAPNAAAACSLCGWRDGAASPFPTALPVGSVLLGRYAVGRVLGKGGFGVTYLAFDLPQNEAVAIKEYFPDTLAHRNTGAAAVTALGAENETAFRLGAEKFYGEARILAQFASHPNIIQVREFFYENNTAYYVMEYIRGVDLKRRLEADGRALTQAQLLAILPPLCDALEAVHAQGILHRDISPDNVFLTAAGGVKLLDFGAARMVPGWRSRTLSVVLKPGFAPVEQYQTHGRQGPWTDVYALAATAYYALTGRVPVSSMDRVLDDALPPPSRLGADISPALEAVLLRAMAVRAEDRFQSVAELRAALKSAGTQETPAPAENNTPGQAQKAAVKPQGTTWRFYNSGRRNTIALALFLFGVTLAICAAAVIAFWALGVIGW